MRKHRTAEQWQVLIGQQRDSGLSATQFCKEHKLGYYPQPQHPHQSDQAIY